MATLVNRVRAISQTAATDTSDNEVVEFLKQGGSFLVNGLPVNLLWFAATNSTNITHDNGYVSTSDKVVGVKRNNVECRQVPASRSYAYNSAISGTTSLFKATKYFPYYYQQIGRVFVKPAPSATAIAVVSYVKTPSTILSTSTSWNISVLDHPAIKYAASLDCQAVASNAGTESRTIIEGIVTELTSKLTAFVAAIPTWSPLTAPTITQAVANLDITVAAVTGPTISITNVEDALLKAQYLIDNLGNTDAESWLTNEDAEMVSAAINTASQEVNRARAEIEKYSGSLQKYVTDVQYEIGKHGPELQEYELDIQREVVKWNADLQKYNAEVQDEAARFRSELEKAQSYLAAADRVLARYNLVTAYNEKARLYAERAAQLVNEAMRELETILMSSPMGLGLRANQGERR